MRLSGTTFPQPGRRTVPVLLALLPIVFSAACTEGTSGGQASPTSPTAASMTPSQAPTGPPMRFDTDSGVPLPPQAAGGRITINGREISPLPLLLHDGVIYLATSHDLQLLHTNAALVFRTIVGGDGKGKDADGGRWVTPPLPMTVRSRSLVLAPFPTGEPGQPGRIRLVAVDTRSRTQAWTRSVTPQGTPASARDLQVRTVGASQETLVLTVSGDGVTDTYAVDLPGGKVRWRLPGFTASTVNGTVVVGISGASATRTQASVNDEQRVRGVSLAKGEYVWTAAHGGYGSAVQGAGDRFVVVTRPTGVATGVFALLRASDGSQIRSWKGKDFGQTCHNDGAGTTVCGATDPQAAVAIDDATGKILWQLPDPSAESTDSPQRVPQVTTAWNGVVYGQLDDNAVVLDARDGHVLSKNAGIAPILVDNSAGIAFDLSDSRVKAFAVLR